MIPSGAGTPASGQPAGPAALADRIAAAVTGCAGVARLAPGPLATYLPGRTVPGIAVRDEAVVVAMVARYGHPLRQIANEVRTTVSRLAPDKRVDVAIDDIDLPDGSRSQPSGE